MAGDASRRGVQGQQPLRNQRDNFPATSLTVVESAVSGLKGDSHKGIAMTKAHSIVYRLYLAAALLALALSGHYTLEANGGFIADHLQNHPAHAPAHVDDSEHSGYVTSTGRRS